jgi:hypothetical protein
MAKTVLFSRPWNDPLTSYLHTWTEDLLKLAGKHSDAVINIEGPKANKKSFTSYVKKSKPTFLQLNGHGNDGLMVGHDEMPLLDSSNVNLTKGTIIYSRSCSTAKVLGVLCINAGAKCYIGYKDYFYMPRDKHSTTKPLDDKVAACTLEPSNQLIRSLLKGHCAEESQKRARKVSMHKLSYLMSSNAPDGSYLYRFAVISNMRNQVILGDKTATY